VRLLVNGISFWLADSQADAAGQVPLLLLHGFTGSADTWEELKPELGARRRLLAVDLIGHARSDAPSSADRYAMSACVEDLVGLLDQMGVARCDVLGYSMGGRVALHLAASAPTRVRRLLVVSGSPGIVDPRERQARIQADALLADSIEREGIEAFVARWEATPLLALADDVPHAARERQRGERLAHSPRGLANSLRGMGAGSQAPLWDAMSRLEMPTLLIVGERDARYRQIARDMASRLPDARVKVVAGAGHVVQVDRPRALAAVVDAFLGP